jgi:hypothetical protein
MATTVLIAGIPFLRHRFGQRGRAQPSAHAGTLSPARYGGGSVESVANGGSRGLAFWGQESARKRQSTYAGAHV